jgi:hypothetical protein
VASARGMLLPGPRAGDFLHVLHGERQVDHIQFMSGATTTGATRAILSQHLKVEL